MAGDADADGLWCAGDVTEDENDDGGAAAGAVVDREGSGPRPKVRGPAHDDVCTRWEAGLKNIAPHFSHVFFPGYKVRGKKEIGVTLDNTS